MKKQKNLVTLVLTLVLALSISCGCLAGVYVDYSFTTEIDGMESTVVFGRADQNDTFDEIGVTVNGKDYKVADDQLARVKATKRFGIEFKGWQEDITAAIPYKVAEGEKTTGTEYAIDKNATPAKVTEATIRYNLNETDSILEVFCDDKSDSAPKISGSANYIQASITKDTGNSAHHKRMLFVKIDISKLPSNVDTTRKFAIKLNSRVTPSNTNSKVTGANVYAYLLPDDFNWDTEKTARLAKDANTSSYAEDMEKYAKDERLMSVTNLGITEKYNEFNITPAINQAIALGRDYAVMAFALKEDAISASDPTWYVIHFSVYTKFPYDSTSPKLVYYKK